MIIKDMPTDRATALLAGLELERTTTPGSTASAALALGD